MIPRWRRSYWARCPPTSSRWAGPRASASRLYEVPRTPVRRPAAGRCDSRSYSRRTGDTSARCRRRRRFLPVSIYRALVQINRLTNTAAIWVGYSYKASYARPVKSSWHTGTLTLSWVRVPGCQKLQMTTVPVWQIVGVKGLNDATLYFCM